MNPNTPLPAVPSGDGENSLAARVAWLHAELEAASTDFRRLEIRDQARAAREAARILDRQDIVLAASELVARAERAVVRNNPPAQRGRGKKNVNPGLTYSRQVVSAMRAAHSQSNSDFEAIVQEHHELGVPITRKSLRDGPCAPGMRLRSGRDEWWTPPDIVSRARTALGGIDLDPASIAGANKVVRATRFFDRETDGLTRPWSGRVFMNPPFSVSVIGKFIDKLLTEPDVSAWVCLVNNGTETRWGQKLLCNALVVAFPASRVRFCGPDAAGKQGAPLSGQLIAANFKVAPAEGIARFVESFSPLGVVLPGGASLAREEVPRC